MSCSFTQSVKSRFLQQKVSYFNALQDLMSLFFSLWLSRWLTLVHSDCKTLSYPDHCRPYLSHLCNFVPGRCQFHFKFSLNFKWLSNGFSSKFLSNVFPPNPSIKSFWEILGRNQVVSSLSRAQRKGTFNATFSAIAWAPDSLRLWQRLISLCRSLSLRFARDFELRFTWTFLGARHLAGNNLSVPESSNHPSSTLASYYLDHYSY